MRNENARPANATAARVIAAGTHHAYHPDECHVISDVPLPIRDLPSDTPDLTGTTFGRLTVCGLSATHNGRWVCRCRCGAYVMRKAKTVKAASTVAMCDPCSLREMALRDEYHRRTGRFVSLEDFTRGK